MLKYLFAAIVLLHGLIHLMGFAKAFQYGNITQLTTEISRPAGIVWMMTALVFILGFALYMLKKDAWPMLAIIAGMMSQILIFSVWKDAKSGTFANILILSVAVISFADIRFNSKVQNECAKLLNHTTKTGVVINEDSFTSLPPMVQQWLLHSGIAGKKNIDAVRLQQKGTMRTKPDGKWMSFTATQYFDPTHCSFIWHTDVEIIPLLFMSGRDKLIDGKGSMQIKLLSLFNIVNASNEKITSGSMIRLLAEICWFPSAALSKNIHWEAIDSSSAKATLSYHDQVVSGTFYFNSNGDVTGFSAYRYYGGGKDARLEKWVIQNEAYKSFDGIRIPTHSKVYWKLKDGDFYWLNLGITDIAFNKPELYNR